MINDAIEESTGDYVSRDPCQSSLYVFSPAFLRSRRILNNLLILLERCKYRFLRLLTDRFEVLLFRLGAL